MIESKKFDNVWDAIEETPEEATKMKVLSELMIQVTRIVEQKRWTPSEAAEHFHTSIAKMDHVLQGRIYELTVDDLLEMVGGLGRAVRIEIVAA